MRGNVPLDKGLFDAKDEAWRKVRSVLTPTFSALKLRELVLLIDDAVDILLKRLQQRMISFKEEFVKQHQLHLVIRPNVPWNTLVPFCENILPSS